MANSISKSVYTSLHPPAPTLERLSLKDQATSLLREYIVKGRLAAGSKLIERELAEWLGVSRMPVHDALVQLEKEGLVISKPDARYVIDISRQDLYELFQVRVVLERLAAELAAQNNSPEFVACYAQLQEIMKNAVERRDIEAFIDGHMDIHRTIWRQSRNPHLQKALDSILGLILMFMARSEYINWDDTLERHGGIIAAIQQGDPEQAGESMARHIVQSLNHTMQTLKQEIST